MDRTDTPAKVASTDELGQLRAALDGLAFADYQAGENGLAFLSDCGDVAAWIEVAMQHADKALAVAVCAALERRAEYGAALLAVAICRSVASSDTSAPGT